jgi:hypothetical protein
MNKFILKPGNGITFPKKGDYLKCNLLIYEEKNIIFDSKKIGGLNLQIGIGSIINELEELLCEMSLNERCSLEIERKNLSFIVDKGNFSKILIEVEIIEISPFP